MRIKLKKTVNIGGNDVPKGSVLEVDDAEGNALCTASCASQTTQAVNWHPSKADAAVYEDKSDKSDKKQK